MLTFWRIYLAALGVVREPLEHGVETSRLLAGRHRGAIDLREDLREFGEAVGERVALHHARAHAEQDALDARLLGLLRDREQRFLERQAGAHQRGELACEQGEIGRGDAARESDAETLLAARLGLHDFGDVDRQQLLLAQELADLPRRIALDDAFAFAAGVSTAVYSKAPNASASADVRRERRSARDGCRSVLACDTQELFERGRRRSITLARPSSRMLGLERARVALELVLAGAVVDHGAHGVVDADQLVDAGAAAIAAAGIVAGPIQACGGGRIRRQVEQSPLVFTARRTPAGCRD